MDVRNSKGKFDEIKEKFVINPAPIDWQSSLNAGDHDELEIFLEIRLIPSRIDQKFRFKGRIHGILKREIGPILRAMETVVGAICSVVEAVLVGEDVASGLALTQPQFRFNFCFKMAAISATIGP